MSGSRALTECYRAMPKVASYGERPSLVPPRTTRYDFPTIATRGRQLSPDGELTVGRLESRKHWVVQVPLKLDPPVDGYLSFNRDLCPVDLSANGEVCAVFSGDQIVPVVVQGAVPRQTIKAPGEVERVRISNDGRRFFAVYAVPSGPTIGLLYDLSDGHYAKLPRATHRWYCRGDWAGQDKLVKLYSRLVTVATLGDGKTEKFLVDEALTSPMAVSRDGTVLAACSQVFRDLCIIDIPAAAMAYPPLRTTDLDVVRMISVSGNGRKVAVSDGRRVFLADMKEGNVHQIIPVEAKMPRSLAIVIPSMFLLGGSIWLFWQTRLMYVAKEVDNCDKNPTSKKNGKKDKGRRKKGDSYVAVTSCSPKEAWQESTAIRASTGRY